MIPDPRTALLTVVVINTITLTHGPLSIVFAGAALTTLLLLLARKFRALFIFLALFISCTALFLYGQYAPGALGYIGFVAYWFSRFSVSVGIGAYAIITIRSGELIAALRAIYTPQWVVIPIAVILRMFPMIGQEAAAIREAMVLRGLQPGFLGAVLHPVKHGELIVVPLISTVVRAGDELAAAALIRGLGGPTKPTSVTPLRFGILDAFLLISLAALILLYAGVIP